MNARYSVRSDHALDLIEISVAGFFSPADIAAFDARRREEIARLGCAPGRHRTLLDVSELQVQSQEAVAAFGRLLADPVGRSSRLALVISRTLVRGQISRALGGRDARRFESRAEARRWLLAADRSAAA